MLTLVTHGAGASVVVGAGVAVVGVAPATDVVVTAGVAGETPETGLLPAIVVLVGVAVPPGTCVERPPDTLDAPRTMTRGAIDVDAVSATGALVGAAVVSSVLIALPA